MAALVAERRSGLPAQAWEHLTDRRVRAVIAVAGTGLALAGGLLLARSDFLIDARAYGLQTAFMVAATVAAALVWLHRRPGNLVGVLLLALALATAVIPLQGADDPYLHSLGVVIEPVFFLLGYLVVFAFPEGRLTGRPGANDPGRDDALLHGGVRPVVVLLARRRRRRPARRLRPVSGERPHDRRPPRDRRERSASASRGR